MRRNFLPLALSALICRFVLEKLQRSNSTVSPLKRVILDRELQNYRLARCEREVPEAGILATNFPTNLPRHSSNPRIRISLLFTKQPLFTDGMRLERDLLR